MGFFVDLVESLLVKPHKVSNKVSISYFTA